jgi:hypothetical protein
MISLLVPSRYRPDQLIEMWHSAIDTAVDQDALEMIVRIDDDDSSYDKLRSRGTRGQIKWISGPRDVLSKNWNEAYEKSQGDIVMHCADDIRFRTPAWDLHVNTAFDKSPDKLIFVYGRDGIHDANLGTHGFLSRRWVEVVGYFVPPYFSSDYNDLWIDRVADSIGRRVYLPEIHTEHLHPVVGKGPLDLCHQERLARGRQDNVDQLYEDLRPKRIEDANKLLKAIAES